MLGRLITLLFIVFALITLTTFIFIKPRKETTSVKAEVVPISPTPTIIYQPSPTPALISSTVPRSNGVWKNYRSHDFGFSLAYPAEWQLLEEPNVFGIEIQKIDKQGLGFSISFRLLENPNNLSIEEFSKAQAYPLQDGNTETPEKVTIGTLTGYKLNHLPGGLLLDLYLPKKQSIINIFAGGDINLTDPKTKSYYADITSQIINTLKIE